MCIGGTCSASSLFVCLLFQLTAKIKAYNQMLLIGPDCGDQPGVSAPALPVIPRLATHSDSRAAAALVSQDSGLPQSNGPADSQLVIIFVCCRPDLAISSAAAPPTAPPSR